MTKVQEEYCWAVTEAAGRSCCGVSSSSVLEFGFQLDCLIQTPQLTKRIQFRLARYLPEISRKSRCAWSNDTTSYPRRTKSMVAWNIFRPRACANVLSEISSANGRSSAVRTAGNNAGTKGMNRCVHFSYPVVSHFLEVVKPCRLSTLCLETNRTTRTAN